MKNFIKDIKIPGDGRLQFFFTKVYTLDGYKYFVTTIDKHIKSHIFYMLNINGSWQIDKSKNTIAEWILTLENEFNSAIRENE